MCCELSEELKYQNLGRRSISGVIDLNNILTVLIHNLNHLAY